MTVVTGESDSTNRVSKRGTPQIIGGTPELMPSAVAIFINSVPSCSGTVLDPRFIITAAHCFDVEGEYEEGSRYETN